LSNEKLSALVISSDVPESYLPSQSHLNFFRVKSKSSFTWSSRVTRTVKSLQVIGLQARDNVESNEIQHFSFLLQNGAQCCFSNFDSRLFRCKILV